MAARTFTADYLERFSLRDGTPALLRLVCRDDMEQLREGFERWSPESRRARFLVPKQRLTDDELRYLCDVDQESHFALCALRDGQDSRQPRGLGIARFIRLPDVAGEAVIAEAAIAVADEVQGQGLGRILFERLVRAASERGIERFRCEVLATNSSMKTLIDKIAPVHQTEIGAGVMTIDFALPALDADRGDSPMYRFFRAAAEGAIEWTESVRQLWRRQ